MKAAQNIKYTAHTQQHINEDYFCLGGSYNALGLCIVAFSDTIML